MIRSHLLMGFTPCTVLNPITDDRVKPLLPWASVAASLPTFCSYKSLEPYFVLILDWKCNQMVFIFVFGDYWRINFNQIYVKISNTVNQLMTRIESMIRML